MRTILDQIVATKRRELEALPKEPVDVPRLQKAVAARGGVRSFWEALRHPRRGRIGLIAEVKRASPSAGVIREDFDPVWIAQRYEQAGADCISVLTDRTYFQGSLEFLRAIREAVGLPLLRKDFIVDPRQVLEAVKWGADAVLLIVAILEESLLKQLLQFVEGAGLTALVEVHNEEELDRALEAGARLIGVNNRDLKTFTVDLSTTERLAARLQGLLERGEVLLVAESGIRNRQDVQRLEQCGVGAMLVGETLMREEDPGMKIRELLGLTD